MDSSLKWTEMSSRFWALHGCRIVAATPLKRAGTLVDPSVTGDHLGHSHRVEAEQSERQTDRVVDEIVVQRQELGVEQGIMQEAHREAQDRHVEHEMPPVPPGRSNRTPGEPGRTPAHQDSEQEKDA